MVRAAEAPVETAKFMGHGFCDHVTKSVSLTNYTSDLSIISKTVFGIKSVLNVPAHELRGIGIQISKLNTSQTNVARKNTLKNMFEKVQSKQNQTTSKVIMTPEKANVQRLEDSDRKASFRKVKSFNGTPSDKPKATTSNKKLHKIYEELDLSVLAELPTEIREEILREKDRVLNADIKNPNEHQITTSKRSFARKLEDDFQEVDLKPPLRISHDEVYSARISYQKLFIHSCICSFPAYFGREYSKIQRMASSIRPLA